MDSNNVLKGTLSQEKKKKDEHLDHVLPEN